MPDQIKLMRRYKGSIATGGSGGLLIWTPCVVRVVRVIPCWDKPQCHWPYLARKKNKHHPVSQAINIPLCSPKHVFFHSILYGFSSWSILRVHAHPIEIYWIQLFTISQYTIYSTPWACQTRLLPFHHWSQPIVIPIGSMVLLYMVTWIPSIYPSHVSIYTSTMDHHGFPWPEGPLRPAAHLSFAASAGPWRSNGAADA